MQVNDKFPHDASDRHRALCAIVSRWKMPALVVLLGAMVLGGAVCLHCRGSAEVHLPLVAGELVAPLQRDTRPLDTSSWMLRGELNTEVLRRAADLSGNSGKDVLEQDGAAFCDVSVWQEHGSLHGDGDVLEVVNRQLLGLPLGLNLPYAPRDTAGMMAICVPPPDAEHDRRQYARRLLGRLAPYRNIVEKYLRRYDLDRELVYAIMLTESGLDPRLVSERFAHGLMQVVPGTAGAEVHTYLYGRMNSIMPENLLNPAVNIRYGMTYLHLLLCRHLSGVVDPVSREYCAVAAYNLGPTALLAVFGSSREKAFAAINAMSPSQVYAALLQRLPSRETRNFLTRVMIARRGFMAVASGR